MRRGGREGGAVSWTAPFDHVRILWGIEKLYYIKRIRFFLYVRLSFMQNYGRIGQYANFFCLNMS